jgi:hypothetical protein
MSVKSKAAFYRAKPEWTRAFFAPLGLTRDLTQDEFEEFDVFKFAESVFCYDDDAPFSQVDGFEDDNIEIEYDNIDISNSALAVQPPSSRGALRKAKRCRRRVPSGASTSSRSRLAESSPV